VCDEVEFRGYNACPGNGQVAGWDFSTPRWIEIECTPSKLEADVVIMISHDEIAVYWKELRHISYFKRVALNDLFHPEHFGTDILDEEPAEVDMLYF